MGLDCKQQTIKEVFENRSIKSLGLLIGLIGLSYLLWKVVSLYGHDLTFKYLWLAGSLWQDGLNPYGNDYMIIGHQLFETFNGQPLYYPPNWWLISNILALFEYEFAMEIWRVGSAAAIIISTFFLNKALQKTGVSFSINYLIFYTGLVCFMQATAVGLATGQTAILLYFALSLIIYATAHSNSFLLAIGLCILLLKPQVGVPLFFALLPIKAFHRPLLYTCILTFILILPALITIGPLETIVPYLKGLSQHSNFATNNPLNSTGLKRFMSFLFSINLSSSIASLLSIIIAIVIGLYYRKRQTDYKDSNDNKPLIGFFITVISLIAFIAPLHEYDLIIVVPIIILAAIYRINFQIFVTAAFLILMRSGNIADLLAPTTADEARYYTASVATLALTTIIAINISLRRKT